MSESEEKTRVTAVVQKPLGGADGAKGNDCVVVIYTKEPSLLGRRFVLDVSPIRIGRGAENHIVLEGDSVSRKHAHMEQRSGAWWCVDDGSTNGSYVNDEQILREARLGNGDRIKVGPTIFKFLSGEDVEAQYHEEIYRMTIIDGLTGAYNKRYFMENLEREIARCSRHGRELSLVIFDIDHFKNINDNHGHLTGDYVLKELARRVRATVRREEIFARYGGEEFTVTLPEATRQNALDFAERIRKLVQKDTFDFEGDRIPVTISIGVGTVNKEIDPQVFVKMADENLYKAKRAGRNRVVG